MKRRKICKLNKIEKAIIELAGFVEDNPFNQYQVRNIILDILGYEILKKPPKNK